MNAKTEIRKIDVKFKLNGEIRHPTSIVAVSRVNAYPTITVTHHLNKSASEEAIKLGSHDICVDMGKRQVRLFTEDRVKAHLYMTDGNGGKLDFNGYVMAPTYQFGPATVNLADIILPEYAIMEDVNLSCYTPGKSTEDVTKDTVNHPQLKDTETVPKYAWEIVKWMRKRWDDARPSDSILFPIDRVQEEEQDRINKIAIVPFKELLENSEDTFGWENLHEWIEIQDVQADEGLLNTFYNLYTSTSGSFFSVVVRMAETFQCLYVPDWSDVGVIVNRNTLMDNPEDYKVETAGLVIRAGGQGMFPVRYVAVSGERINPDTTAPPVVPGSYVCYPESLVENGSMIPVNAPEWLPARIYRSELEKSGKSPQELVLNKGLFEAEKGIVTNTCKQHAENTKHILREWAKSCYIWEALGTTECSVTVPLDLSIKLGVRYNVLNIDGQRLFSGYLKEIIHQVTTAEEGRGSCNTTLRFSHVELPGFTLPR